MVLLDQKYEAVQISSLKTHPRNPRRGDTVAIAESIVHNGFYGAVVAQKSTGYILAGNHRFKAALDTGAETIPVVWLDISDDHALRILLADNRTSDLGGYNEAALLTILKEFEDLSGTGYDEQEIARIIARSTDPPERDEPESGSGSGGGGGMKCPDCGYIF